MKRFSVLTMILFMFNFDLILKCLHFEVKLNAISINFIILKLSLINEGQMDYHHFFNLNQICLSLFKMLLNCVILTKLLMLQSIIAKNFQVMK